MSKEQITLQQTVSSSQSQIATTSAIIDTDIQNFVAAFFKVVMKLYGYNWRTAIGESGDARYIFNEDQLRILLSLYANHETRLIYRGALWTLQNQGLRWIGADLPFLRLPQMWNFIIHLPFQECLLSRLGSLLFLSAYLIRDYLALYGTIEFVDGFVDVLSKYFTEEHANEVQEVGGWEKLRTIVNEGRFLMIYMERMLPKLARIIAGEVQSYEPLNAKNVC